MPTLQEILAAKKASTAATQNNPSFTDTSTKEVAVKETISQQENKPADTKEIKQEEKKEVATVPNPKPLSFAEKMALKKAQESQAVSSNSVAVKNTAETSTKIVPTTSEAKKEVSPEDNSEIIKATIPTVTQAPVVVEGSDEDRQAYQDIKNKIDALTELSGEPLENAMSDLKKALLKNPNAANLMQDQDIGQMVIALRKITGEAIAEAAKDGRKTKVKARTNIDLTDPDVVATVMAEL